MSKFSTECLCAECARDEQSHPNYRKATDAEREAVQHGGRNFPGIGRPGKNGRRK